jgi:hypothetical protein
MASPATSRSRSLVAVDEGVLPYAEEAVRRVLLDVQRYHEWWPKPFTFEADDGPARAGTRLRAAQRPLFRWVVTVTAVLPERIDMTYGEGSWEGDARWTLRPVLEGTAVVHRIALDPRPLWLRLLAGRVDLARRHSRHMKAVFAALEKRLASLGEPRVPEPVPQPPSARSSAPRPA